ncbi:MAG: ketoacyl-ACP synthase III [Deltaproteobacteria bacterium]|jgi:3-oxoacyl-[acyl-carrier-protein] synthase-3|nr:ketoacyl-ACP synthase III [Deltaproteobacteria bacterium]
MPFLEFHNVSIAGIACAVPSYVQTIDSGQDNSKSTYIKHFIKQTGIRQRHISLLEQTCTDLSYAASLKAMKLAGWSSEDIDAVVFITQTPDYTRPGNACLLQYMLGLTKNTLAFDINLGCSAFPYGLSVCGSLLQHNKIRRIIMACGDAVWPFYVSREAVLADDTFVHGEGGAAVLLEKKNATPLCLALYTDGSGFHYLFDPKGARNAWRELGEAGIPVYGGQMDGVEITTFSTTTAVDAIKEFTSHYDLELAACDGLVLHQANLQIIKTMAKRLNMDPAKVPVSLDRYANTSSASVPLTIADAYAGCEKEQLFILAAGFGIGLSWGVASLTISPLVIEPIFIYDGVFKEGFIQ